MDKIINGFTERRFDRMTLSEQLTELLRDLTEEGKGQTETISRIISLISGIAEIIENQDERISQLSEVVYALAPEYEVIETMSADEEEKTELLARYMNRNENYNEC